MSVDHRPVGHDVLAILDSDNRDCRYHQFAAEQSGGQMVQRIVGGQPALIGIEPFIPPKEWQTETFILPWPPATGSATTGPAATSPTQPPETKK